jgi:hypothetical protein
MTNGSLGVVGVKLAALGGFFLWFAQGLAIEGEAVRGWTRRVAAGATSGWREEDIEARRRPAPVAHPGEQFYTYAVSQRAHPPGPNDHLR